MKLNFTNFLFLFLFFILKNIFLKIYVPRIHNIHIWETVSPTFNSFQSKK